jgi:RHS repeat-associated protein
MNGQLGTNRTNLTNWSRLKHTTRIRSAGSFFVALVVLMSFAIVPSSVGATGVAPSNSAGTRLYAGQVLHVGQRLTSPSGQFNAVLQPHGVIEILRRGTPVWTSTSGTGLSNVVTRLRSGALAIRSSRSTSTGSKASGRSYFAMQNNENLILFSASGVAKWQGGLHANLWSPSMAPYSRNEFFGNSNPSATCFTCEAANVSGIAPPSNTLDSASNVNNMTGDFTTSNSLFSAPAIGGSLSLSLSYDAQLAQSQVASGLSPGPFGEGWSSDFSASVNQQSGSTVTSSITVNQGNGAQVTFNQSANSGTSTSCQPPAAGATGDYPLTSKYTAPGSNLQWCALASVRGQISDLDGTAITYQTQGGVSTQDFAWNGQLAQTTTLTASSGSQNAGLFMLYNVAGGSVAKTATGITLVQQCPASSICTIVYASDGRDLVEVLNASGLVTQVIDPSGATYALSYSTTNNLLSVTKPSGGPTPSTWNYVYSSASSPYSSDLVQIYDADAGVTTPAPLNPGATHSETIAYTAPTSSDPGMVASLTDGTGASTTYSYTNACATGQCVTTGQSQLTTVTYPPEVPCPSCTAQSPVETDQYNSGLETSTTLGSSTNASQSETWNYSWNLGNGSANSTEQITYPATLNTANHANWSAPTATIVWDPAGNVVSTTNALGDVATSAYNDVGGNNLPELLWSYPGPSSNSPSNPPLGSSVYAYNNFGQVTSATDPVGSTTDFGYYATYSLLCYATPPSVSAGLGSSPSCGGADSGASGAPVGATAYSYDAMGNVAATTLDVFDSGANADVQTTTSGFDTMGNQTWIVPPTGQSGTLGPSNLYATSTTYSSANLPVTVSAPGGMTTTTTYDAMFNVLTSTTPAATRTTVFDGDNRACYTVVGAAAATGLTCSSSAQSGSSATSYVPGSITAASSTDASGNVTSSYFADLAYPMSPTQVVDPMGSQQQYAAYDDYGNACVAGSVQPTLGMTQCATLGGDLATVFDPLANKTSVTDQSGNVTTNYFENASYPTLLTRTVNPLGATALHAYDGDGRLATTTNPDGTALTTAYNLNGQVCSKAPTAFAYPCSQGPSVAGVTQFTYNNAGERVLMADNSGSPATPMQWSQNTTYSYANGQLISTTDSNNKTVSYRYDTAGRVACVAYPVSSGATCGTNASPATGSTSNTIQTRSYDASGRLSATSDWLGNSVAYGYANASAPGAVTSITYPASTGLSAAYGYDQSGNVTSLTASGITDAWTYNHDQQVATTSINGATSAPVTYNANHQVTGATSLATSTSNDSYTVAANGTITADAPPVGSSISSTYDAGAQLCSASAAGAVACGTTPSNGVGFAFNANGQRTTATSYVGGVATSSLNYAWNAFGELCASGPTPSTCATPTTGATTYSYNGDGLRVTTSASSSTTSSTWDAVSGGSIPLTITDATTTSSSSTNASYLYGNVLFGGTAPVEQISGSTAVFLVTSPTGVQGVYGATGTSLEQALYSPYGSPTITSGAIVTPFGFQGSYTDATGMIYLINRYYDPTTDQFLSIDLLVDQTNQPYLFVNDNPLNTADPLGLCGRGTGYYPGACATTAKRSIAAEKYIESHVPSRGFSFSGGISAVVNVGQVAVSGLDSVRHAISTADDYIVNSVPSNPVQGLKENVNTLTCAAKATITFSYFSARKQTIAGVVRQVARSLGLDAVRADPITLGIVFTASAAACVTNVPRP